MSAASIFYDPPVVARRVYAGEVRVIDDIKFWDKTTKVVHSRIYSDDNNLNVEVKDTDKELNFFTNQITFHDAGGTQLGYIDSEGTIHGLSVDGHATNVDITDLEDDLTSLQSTVTTLDSDVSGHDTRIDTLENAGYVTGSALSAYATTTSLTNGLSGKVDTTTLNNYPTTAAVLNLLSGKVDTSTLTNYYTTSQVNNFLAGKVDTSTLTNYYTTSALDTLLNAKVNTTTLTSDYTTTAGLTGLLAGKQDTGNYLTGVQVGTVSTGTPAAVTASTSGATTTLDFNLPVSPFVSSGNDIYYSSGNVGIGVASPLTPLHISSANEITTSPAGSAVSQMRYGSTNSTVLFGVSSTAGHISAYDTSNFSTHRDLCFNADGGNVGIGTNAPMDNARLTIKGGNIHIIDDSTPDSRSVAFYEDDGTTQIGFMGQGSGSHKDMYLWGRSDSQVRIGAGNAQSILVKTNGDVGVGTSDPDAKLHVNGNTLIGSRRPYNAAGFTDAQLMLGGSHNTAAGYNTSNLVKLLISGGDNDGASPYYIMCEDENGYDLFYLKGSTSQGGLPKMYHKGELMIGSTSRGLRGVTGSYGSVQTTGNGVNGWRGYSINGQWVFMADSVGGAAGIYNDVDNEWAFYARRNAESRMYYNGGQRVWAGNTIELSGNGTRIYGIELTYNYTNAQSDWWTNGGSIQADPPNLTFGLYVANYVRAHGYVATSDRRIKKDFLELDDGVALEKLRRLRPTSYRYKDRTRNTTGRVIGFVAQEVAEVLPDAVSTAPNIIPSIQTEASVTKIGEAQFEFTLLEPHIVSVGATLVLKTPTEVHMECKVETVTDDTTFTGKITGSQELPDDATRVWVTGEMVDDFHHLDKNAIFTVATSALQEVDRQQQADKARIAELEAKLQNVLDRLQALQTVGG